MQRRWIEDLTTQLTLRQTAAVLGATTDEVRALIADGKLEASGRGSHARVKHQAVDGYLRTLDTTCPVCGGRRTHHRRNPTSQAVTERELADPGGRRLEWLRAPSKKARGRLAPPWASLTHDEQLAEWEHHFGEDRGDGQRPP